MDYTSDNTRDYRGLSKSLYHEAMKLGLCKDWQCIWPEETDVYTLLSMLKDGIEFCIEHDFPSCGLVKRFATDEELRESGIFIGANVDGEFGSGVYVLMGSCSGTIRFRRWSAATIYLRHDSDIRIVADEGSRIHIRLYDNAGVETEKNGSARVVVRDHRI